MHAAEIILFLEKTDSLKLKGLLTPQEIFQLELVRKIINGQRNMVRVKKSQWNSENYLGLSLLGKVAPSVHQGADIGLKGIINPRFSGCLGKISYITEIGVWTEYQSDTAFAPSSYQPFDGTPYNLYGRARYSSIRSSDAFRGGISYQGQRYCIETGVDNLSIGPAEYYRLTLSGQAPPVTYLRARMSLGHVEYIHSFGLLREQKDRSKYFYLHRLDFPLFRNRVICGINEVIVNGSTAEKAQKDSLPRDIYGAERDWSWIYMIPFVPMKFAEHYAGDLDNAFLSFDLAVFYPKNTRLYMEFLLDDMSSPLTLFTDDYGNKWAYTIGVQYFGCLFKRDLSVMIEYSRIRPWVYSHFYGASHNYAHFGQSLGSLMGPNSDAFIIKGEYNVHKRNSIGIYLKNTRKGMDRGSDINDVFQQEEWSLKPDSKKISFLGNGYTRLTTFGVTWRFFPFSAFSFDADLYIDSENRVGLNISGGFVR